MFTWTSIAVYNGYAPNYTSVGSVTVYVVGVFVCM